MKKYGIAYFINPRNPFAHLLIFLFSLGVILLGVFINADVKLGNSYLGGFMLTFLQVEISIGLAYLFFKKVQPGKTPGEITRIVLMRFALLFISCFAAALVVILTFLHLEQLMAGRPLTNVAANFFYLGFSSWAKPTLLGLSCGGVVFIIILWQDALKREQKLREENLIFQNETLKNQINPHFLFNSLNTLSALMITEPELAEQFINKLSSIYRYVLENIARDRIPLSEELDFIRDYVALHKIRDEGKILLTIEAPGADRKQIIPVSLQILVENAIKHNKATLQNPLTISIFVEGNQVVVKNNLQKMASSLRSTGIGLKNLANRVKLISESDLVIGETNTHYLVKVPLI